MRHRFVPNNLTECSPGLQFLTAARLAMPATMGERDRVGAMSRALHLALECKFRFEASDGEALRRLGIHTSCGIFDPLHMNWYRLACTTGGTYARLWEGVHAIKPWKAHQVLVPDHYAGARAEILLENRLAPGLALLLPGDVASDELSLCRHDGAQVWWCTTIEKDALILCRYGLAPNSRNGLTRHGAPARRRSYSRDEWNALRARHVAAAAPPSAVETTPAPG